MTDGLAKTLMVAVFMAGVTMGALVGYEYARAHQIVVLKEANDRITCEVQP